MTTNNHPANGPVSLERLHQIHGILSKASAQSDGGNLGYAMADAVKVIDGAIAAFGAEPVPFDALRDAVAEVSGGPAMEWGDIYKGHQAVPFINFNSLARIVDKYRVPQPAKRLELAGWQFKSVNGDWLGLIDEHGKNQAVREGCEVREVFAIADSVNDREQVRREHAKWSQDTFGNVGPVGPLKHLSKEALEAAAEPGDLSEWADMQFLLWDAQRRTGISDEQITQAMVEKLAVNKQRKWPEPKDGEPRLHIKEQPAPVVPDGYCIMPVALTAKNGAKWALSGEFSAAREVTCPECEGDGCSDCDGRGDWYEDQAIDWTTIKEIYRRAVEVCALPTGQTQDKIA